jgi:hypothetical protein
MALIISHGVPKSGSTFLFQVAKDVATSINGFPHYKAKARFFPGMEVPDYVDQPADELIESLLEHLPPGAPYVLKTHGKMTPLIESGIRSGSIKAIVSFRDPRDAVISMLDAGVSDREKGKDRGFSRLYKVDEAVRPVKYGWNLARDWAYFPGVLAIPYLLTAAKQDIVISLVCDYLSAGHCYKSISGHYAQDKRTKITEFHKGVADRFLDDLTPEEIAKVSESLESEIAENDALTAQWMQAYGFRMLHQASYERRETRLKELLA